MIERIPDPQVMQQRALAWRAQGLRVAFVPTMGYLHEGHATLLRDARKRGDVLVLSIFVNPTQFGPNEDFDRYPRDLDRDLSIAGKENTDVVFLPTREAMYPAGFSTYVQPGVVAEPLEGKHRPGHFKGVATVVLKLFQCVQPHVAVFGEKDWQQLAVIRRMARDLDLPVEVAGHPIVREPDGLAMSSRNVYLSPAERARALSLSRALGKTEAAWKSGERARASLEALARETIDADSIDYAALVDPDSMEPAADGAPRALLALAVRIGKTRLIDNRLYS